MGNVGIDGVVVSRCCRRGIVGNGVEVDHGVPGDHVKLLCGDVFRGSSLEVLGFLVHLEVMCWVIGEWGLECGWEWVGFSRLGGVRRGWYGCCCLGGYYSC